MNPARRSFDERAREWDDDPKKRERALTAAKAIAAEASIAPGSRALEIGCGTGLVSFSLHEVVPGGLGHVVLADTSAGMLEVLGEKIDAAGLAEVFEARRYDLAADRLPDDRFDVIYSLMVWHHIPQWEVALAAARALLRPGGRLCIADLASEDGSYHGLEVDVHHGFDPEELGGRALAHGFTAYRHSVPLVLHKEVDGVRREFPLFLLVAEAPA